MVEGRVGNLVHEEAGPSPEASSRCTIGPNTTFSRPLRDCRPPTVSGSALSPNCSASGGGGSRTAADRPTRGFSAHPDVVVRAPFERATAGPERVTLASRAVLDRRETRETVDDAKDAISDGPDRQRALIEELSRIATAYPTPTTSARPPRVVVRPSPTTCRGGRWSRVTSARSTYSLPSPVRGSPPRSSTLLLPRPAATATRGSATRRRRRWPCSARATSSAWTPTRSCSRRPPSSVARRTRTARGPTGCGPTPARSRPAGRTPESRVRTPPPARTISWISPRPSSPSSPDSAEPRTPLSGAIVVDDTIADAIDFRETTEPDGLPAGVRTAGRTRSAGFHTGATYLRAFAAARAPPPR